MDFGPPIWMSDGSCYEAWHHAFLIEVFVKCSAFCCNKRKRNYMLWWKLHVCNFGYWMLMWNYSHFLFKIQTSKFLSLDLVAVLFHFIWAISILFFLILSMDRFYFFSFAQAAAAAQAGASVIQIFVGRIRVISIFICVIRMLNNKF